MMPADGRAGASGPIPKHRHVTDVFNFRPYTRLKQLQYLLQTGQIDDQFYWTRKNGSESRKDFL